MSAVDTVKQSNGSEVLHLSSRIGAAPFFRYVDGEWEALSLMHIPSRDYSAESRTVHLVRAHPDVTEEWLRECIERTDDPPEPVEILGYDETPFADTDEIPHRDEIVEERECPSCGEEYREYLPDPFGECGDCRFGEST